jgi:hypothetical protein
VTGNRVIGARVLLHSEVMRRFLVLPALTLLALLPVALPSTAGAAPARPTVFPAAPKPSEQIVVRWKADRAYGPKARLRLGVQFQGGSGCTATDGKTIRTRVRKGQRVSATFTPRPVWCTGGNGQALVQRGALTLSSRSFTLAPGALDAPASIVVLEGSATTQVAGRPDRAAKLKGNLKGGLPFNSRDGDDFNLTVREGGLQVEAPAADPLCTADGAPFPRSLNVAPGGGLLIKDRNATLTLNLAADPAAFTGCTPAAPAASLTATLTGKVGPGGIARVELNGAVPNVALAGGATATVNLRLVVFINLVG